MSVVDIRHGDCRAVLTGLPEASIDACVTDPPYGLGFMGKGWDKGVPGVEFWAAVYRVLKPGAHLLAFSGTRTYHRLTCAIEDAGFEIRDQIGWAYSTGFPKSRNIGCRCARNGAKEASEYGLRSLRDHDVSPAAHAEVRERTVLHEGVSQQGAPEDGATAKIEAVRGRQPGVEGRGHIQEGQGQLCGAEIRSMPGALSFDGEGGRLCDGTSARDGDDDWPLSGADRSGPSQGSQPEEQRAGQPGTFRQQLGTQEDGGVCAACGGILNRSGWGTALKPAWEPICVARKPLIGTVAANVLQYGTGALNVDGCRIPSLTGQRPSDTMSAWAREKNLCDLCAGLAASPAKRGIPETRGISAGSRAAPIMSGKGEIDRADTVKADTGCFAGLSRGEQVTVLAAGSSSSIDASGKVQTDRSRQDTKSTTSTAMGSTTGSRTCNACGCSITDPGTSGSTQTLRSAMPNTPAAQGNAAPTGRWPSNLIHDGSDEVLACFPQTSSRRGTITSKPGAVYGGGAGLPSHTGVYGFNDSGSAARFFYCAKASKSDRGEGNKHPTVKPTTLMAYLCRLVTPPGGTVLDPFAGSGTTGMAAMREGFDAILIDLEAESVADIKRRIAHVQGADAPLFAEPSREPGLPL